MADIPTVQAALNDALQGGCLNVPVRRSRAEDTAPTFRAKFVSETILECKWDGGHPRRYYFPPGQVSRSDTDAIDMVCASLDAIDHLAFQIQLLYPVKWRMIRP